MPLGHHATLVLRKKRLYQDFTSPIPGMTNPRKEDFTFDSEYYSLQSGKNSPASKSPHCLKDHPYGTATCILRTKALSISFRSMQRKAGIQLGYCSSSFKRLSLVFPEGHGNTAKHNNLDRKPWKTSVSLEREDLLHRA